MTRLTEHFTLEEMVFSQMATRMNIDNNPSEKEVDALRLLCQKILEPLRSKLATPIYVSSGFRSPTLNRAIGGSPTSQRV